MIEILLVIFILFIFIALLKITKLGCFIGIHSWKRDQTIAANSKHPCLVRKCKHCSAFQTKEELSQWVSIDNGASFFK